MPVTSLIRFVGNGFRSSMLDDRSLFDLKVADRTIYDEFAKVTYGGTGAYELRVSPGEITVQGQPHNALSDRLIDAARHIASMLAATAESPEIRFLVWQTAGRIEATTESNYAAMDFCRGLTNMDGYERAVGKQALTAFPRIIFVDSDIDTYFDIRIEPAFGTGGKDLYIVVDARRQLEGNSLEAVLATTEEVRQRMNVFRTKAHELFDAGQVPAP